MLRRRPPTTEAPLSEQVADSLSRRRAAKPEAPPATRVVSTGSTLLDLAISGGVNERGGVPAGILVEIFGPAACGKTVILCEMAGGVQRAGGAVMFRDPEARLNEQFAKMFGFRVEDCDYARPDTVTALFGSIRKWNPENDSGAVNAIFADSLAALSTDMEMADKDAMGQRRAKEFSEECRKVCRVLASRGILMVCSNQVRQNVGGSQFEPRFKSPGGEAIGFYSSLRLRCHSPQKLYRERKVGGKDVKRVIAVETTVEVHKNSVDRPYRTAPIVVDYEYGMDDVRANLEWLKSSTGESSFNVLGDGVKLGVALERAIKVVEAEGLQDRLRDRTVEVWRDVERKFASSRRPRWG